MVLRVVKRFVPSSIKTVLREHHRSRALVSSVNSVLANPNSAITDPAVLEKFAYGWGNPGWAPQTSYLHAVADAALSGTGPILECGSGCTTLLLGALAKATGRSVWSLEHVPDWADRVEQSLTRLGLSTAGLCRTPLKSFGEYHWYDVPLDTLPDDFDLAICDGPPSTTPGGRVGLLHVMRSKFTDDAVILMDDGERIDEQEIANLWVSEYGGTMTSEGEDSVLIRVVLAP